MHNNGHISKCITGNIKAKFKVNKKLKNLAPAGQREKALKKRTFSPDW
jgi:hypothetical protein